MALRHAEFCTRCGEIRTRHESGVCSQCRRRRDSHCRICGKPTSYGRDICYLCAARMSMNKDLDRAIRQQRLALQVLEKRQKGLSFGDIASDLDMPKTTVYDTYSRAMRLPALTPEADAS